MLVKANASGAQSAVMLSKKEYGVKHSLKGAALNKAHFDYKKAQMSSNAKLIGAALLTGEIGVTRLGLNKKQDGGSLSFKSIASLVAPKAKKDETAVDLSKLSESDIMAYLESKGYEVIVAE